MLQQMVTACEFAIIDAQTKGHDGSKYHELKALATTYITNLVPIAAQAQEKQTAQATFIQAAMQLLGQEAKLDPSTKLVSGGPRHRAIGVMTQTIQAHVQRIATEVSQLASAPH
jgi:hypothetical protein